MGDGDWLIGTAVGDFAGDGFAGTAAVAVDEFDAR